MSIDKLIQAKINAFTAELAQLVREAAVEQVRMAFGGEASPAAAAPAGRARPAASAAAPVAKAAAAPRSRAAGRTKGAKRPPGEIARMVEQVATWVAANGGRRVEEMGAALGVPTTELTLPIKKLLKAGRLRAQGQKRATRYFAASAPAAAATGKRGGAAAKRGAAPAKPGAVAPKPGGAATPAAAKRDAAPAAAKRGARRRRK